MPAAGPIIAAVITGVGMAVETNQARKAAEGARNEADQQKRDTQVLLNEQKKKDQIGIKNKADVAGTTQKAAIDAIRASMSSSTAMGGTILTGPQGTAGAPAQGKTLLGV